jgi:NAD(P)-dependent dehydrogenase (short-subunit alcohol dehydrogenase family)
MKISDSASIIKSKNPNERAVLITGCSSGIGRATAVYLAQQGIGTVFASVRKESDRADLASLGLPNLIPICPLDLAKPEQIQAAVETIQSELAERGIQGLYALINNAGGGFIAPIELMDLGQFEVELQARILGPLALLQALLPLIRQAHGRLLWIVSPGLIASPYIASLDTCFFAINYLARVLNLELKPWQIPSIMIRCGGILTAAPAKTDQELETAFKNWPPERLALYDHSLHKQQGEFAEFDKRRTSPKQVAKVVFRALTAVRPKHRYQVGYLSGAAAFLEALPQPLADWIMASRA